MKITRRKFIGYAAALPFVLQGSLWIPEKDKQYKYVLRILTYEERSKPEWSLFKAVSSNFKVLAQKKITSEELFSDKGIEFENITGTVWGYELTTLNGVLLHNGGFLYGWAPNKIYHLLAGDKFTIKFSKPNPPSFWIGK
jgi:hypothetical protein